MTDATIQIAPVKTPTDIAKVANLAKSIWRQHFTPIIGEAQVSYMLNHFQSAQAIQHQISFEHVDYFLAHKDNHIQGYMALILAPNQHKIMLSKLYVAENFRGKGIGKALLNHAEQIGNQLKKTDLWLTVNRHNHHTIDWYHQQGFTIIDKQQKDIGNGFIMDDYIMQKHLQKTIRAN